jgi:Lsr2
MAQKVTIHIDCDMPHDGGPAAGTQTIRFALDGTHYEIDACDPHAEGFQSAVGGYTAFARKTDDPGRPRPARPAARQPAAATRQPPPRTAAAREERATIRSWAAARFKATRDTKYQCSDRGRLPVAVAALYYAELGATPR